MRGLALGFASASQGPIIPGAEVGRFEAFSFSDGKLQPNTLDGKEPSTREANASDARLSNGPSTGGGLCAVSEQGYTNVPDSIVDQLGHTGAFILCRVLRFASGPKGYCDASAETLAKACRIDTATAKRWRAKLIAEGYLSEVGRTGRTPRLAPTGKHLDPAANGAKRTDAQAPTAKPERRKMHRPSAQNAPLNGAKRNANNRTTGTTVSEAKASSGAAAPGGGRKPDPHFDAYLALFGIVGKPGRHAGLASEFAANCRAHGVAVADIPRWKKSAIADKSWQYVQTHNAWARFFAWWEPRRKANGHDSRFFVRDSSGSYILRDPQLVKLDDLPGFDPRDSATWPPDMAAAYAGSAYMQIASERHHD